MLMNFIQCLETLGKRYAAKRQDAVEQLGSDLYAVRYARRNQEDAEFGKAVFGLYIEAEHENEEYRSALQSIGELISETLGKYDAE